MKEILLSLSLFLLTFSQALDAQHCIPTVIVFTTQDQVDNFPSNYPGCTTIDGSVGITGSEIYNLNGLSQLTAIGGDVLINADSLSDISGLAGLTTIGGSLTMNMGTLS